MKLTESENFLQDMSNKYKILSHPLIQEGQLSVSGKWMYTSTVKHLED